MAAKSIPISDDSFEQEVLRAEGAVLVDFWAEWCGPCKMVAPLLDELAAEFDGKLKICKLDVDANQVSPLKYGVRGIPTLLLFKDGEVAATKIGALSKTHLGEFINPHL